MFCGRVRSCNNKMLKQRPLLKTELSWKSYLFESLHIRFLCLRMCKFSLSDWIWNKFGPPTQSNPCNDNKRNWWDSRNPTTNGISQHSSSFSECGSYCHRGWDWTPLRRDALTDALLDVPVLFCTIVWFYNREFEFQAGFSGFTPFYHEMNR